MNRTELISTNRAWWLALAATMIFAIALRFVGIGTWSFASDELGTFFDVKMFHGETHLAADDPDRNVPKMVPLAMVLHSKCDAFFGSDERGSRTLPALCAIGQILLVGIGLRSILGRTASITVAVLLAISPENLFYSQYHRFYSPAALFATAAFVAAAHSHRKESVCRMAVSVVAAFLCVLTHTLAGAIFGGLALAALLVRMIPGGSKSNRALIAALTGAGLAMIFAVVYLYPLGKGKAVGYEWEGYSISRSIFSGVSQVTWPVALFAAPGLAILWKRDRVQAMFWGSQAIVWAACLIVLPKLLSFHSAYVFPICLPMFVLAGVAFADIVDRLSSLGSCIAGGCLACLLFLNLPELASYYQDGSRHDFRAAAGFIADQSGADDTFLVVQGDKYEHYRPELKDRWHRLPFKSIPEFIESHRSKIGKTWIVLPGGRSGLPEPWKAWAEQNARLQATIVHRRFDYHEYPIYVLVVDR